MTGHTRPCDASTWPHSHDQPSPVASNESFSGWTKAFTDLRLCAAIVDRPTYGGTIIEPAPPATA